MATSQEQEHALQELAILKCWTDGRLDYKRHATQQIIHRAIVKSGAHGSYFLCCSRRLGKTFELFLTAAELCIQKPGARVLYLMPHAKDAAELASDTSVQIFADCPISGQPEYRAQSKEFIFPNGSLIRLKGVNGEHAQYLRGGSADLVILDECGLMDDLRHAVNDVALPMTMTTGGKVLFATTPARSPGHESFQFYEEHEDAKQCSTFTIRDAPHVTDAVKAQFLRKAGEKPARLVGILAGTLEPETTTAKREYFCQWVTDADTAVVPEWDTVRRAECLIEVKRPEYFDAYTAMDPGMNDKTGILYGYADFIGHKLIIEHESLLSRAATSAIALEVKTREKACWGEQQPLMRVTDIDLRLIADLWQLHGLTFIKAEKSDVEAGINLMRTMLGSGQIIIHPRCTGLDRQLRNATWNSAAKDFERTTLDSHFDLVSALRYLCRAINWSRNPYPEWYRRATFLQWRGSHGSGGRAGSHDPGLYGTTPFGRRLHRKGKAL